MPDLAWGGLVVGEEEVRADIAEEEAAGNDDGDGDSDDRHPVLAQST